MEILALALTCAYPSQVYGALIYKLLGDQAQQQFSRSWGVSYGMNVAAEWKDVLTESIKGAVVLAILERLYATPTASWFEDHLGERGVHAVLACHAASDRRCACPDYYCIQSQLFKHATMNVVQQTRLLWKHTKRISDD